MKASERKLNEVKTMLATLMAAHAIINALAPSKKYEKITDVIYWMQGIAAKTDHNDPCQMVVLQCVLSVGMTEFAMIQGQ